MSFDVSAKLCLNLPPFVLSLLLPSFIHAQTKIDDTIIITADRIQSSTATSPNDVKIFTLKDIEGTKKFNLPEILMEESDLTIVSSGAKGSVANMFLRGTDSSHVLVVLDGIVLNDPSNPNRQFDFSKLSLNNIEKIEILKGSQGLVYGSNAIGGVIFITSKKPKANQSSGSGYVEMGSYKTIQTGFDFQKGYEDFKTSVGFQFLSTEGFSAADESVNTNAEADGNKRLSLNFNTYKNVGDDLKINTYLNYINYESDLDDGGGASADTPNYSQTGEDFYGKFEFEKSWNSLDAVTNLSLSRSTHHRHDKNKFDARYPFSFDYDSIAKGELNSLAIHHTYLPTDKLTQNINLEYSKETDNFRNSNYNSSAFLYHLLELEKNLLNLGLRLDHNRLFKNFITYKAGFSHKFNETLARFSHSTGFKAPSLNQLFDPLYGNKNLRPEESKSYEVGFDYPISQNIQATSTIYSTLIKDRHTYMPVTYVNINGGKAEIYGFEQKTNFKFTEMIKDQLSFNALKTKDLTTKRALARRADFTLKNKLEIMPKDSHQVVYNLSIVSSRADVDNSGNPVTSPSYHLHDLNYFYHANKNAEYYLKLNNIFNREYQEIAGYGTAGRNFSIGAHFNY